MIKQFEEFVRDGILFTEEARKREIREIKINILEGRYMCTDAYTMPKDPMLWLPCKDCGLRPLVWEFDNGRSTACGCGENVYDHLSIHAESIRSVVERCGGSCVEYEIDDLRKNWNDWAKNGRHHTLQQLREQGKW